MLEQYHSFNHSTALFRSWSYARLMVQKLHIKTSALLLWTVRGSKKVNNEHYVGKNHERQKAKRTTTTNKLFHISWQTTTKSLGFNVNFNQASNPIGIKSERSPKKKPQSMDSDWRACSPQHLISVCFFWQSIDSTWLSEVSDQTQAPKVV